MKKLNLENDNTISTTKQQKILVLLSGHADKYEYFTGEDISFWSESNDTST